MPKRTIVLINIPSLNNSINILKLVYCSNLKNSFMVFRDLFTFDNYSCLPDFLFVKFYE